ncbi:hypothetical protein Tco_1123236 [Tanacetum coccineum]|uniref:Uncharacterized protein n=1 Tax=Tanacetum coccineum TaxID=301880 RepID=A0ABQ5J2S7_9ASTR
MAEKPHPPLWVAAEGGGVESWCGEAAAATIVVVVAVVVRRCGGGGDGWRGDAASGRIWWLVVSPEKCGGAGKTGRKMRVGMRENIGARFYDENDSNPNI